MEHHSSVVLESKKKKEKKISLESPGLIFFPLLFIILYDLTVRSE